ncbi:MAG: PUR family DNA/RNA-binding protein [Chitinophagaceae bacterium]|nr:PUR family DNA/RNA-binding protein [Chitinophagaceae bacterium]MDP1811226.1 DUF3276 family protein [Sediminibacterium sp.]MDP3127961.1 DUF3276 family protein [Sediminibacterium sp.]MDP3665260.1 DUF3276 family protein [Sediminibacterium sp.]
MAYENNDKKMESVYSKRIRAGKRRTYFFDVRATRGNDYFLTITESRKRFDDNGYDRHKIFLYKEDFNKFIKALGEAIDYVKTDLMPDFDFDAFNHEYPEGEGENPVSENGEAFVPAVSAEPVPEEPIVEVTEIITHAAPAPTPITDAATADNGASEEVDKW